ncbi:GRP family sugar transporter [Apilactobacillus bombintestini]|uniref:Ribose transporter RbsU n=1 Tax=Apilactobacillus bombintestini TaxID=2419772 RepID=A0A387AYL6_9LACO|nr:GRP family sugar transporter [Apilactobacillus bombintestini]AYF92150.1 ribose transporter RbsU [Apilactobacillus bombintestini]
MNFIALAIGLIPFFGWGFYPTVASHIGGKPSQQIFGSTLGAVIFASLFVLVTGVPYMSPVEILISYISGMCWAFAQLTSFKSYKLVGSSITTPISAMLQLVYISLWGVILLGDWHSIIAKTIGFIALISMIAGAFLTSWKEVPEKSSTQALKKAWIWMILGSFGFLMYSVLPQTAQISGSKAFFFQTLGMLTTAIINGIITYRDTNIFNTKLSYKNIIGGFFFAIAAVSYLISSQPNMNGVATGFILAQTSVIMATMSAIYLLKQYKTKKEMVYTWIGLLLIVISGCFTSFIK